MYSEDSLDKRSIGEAVFTALAKTKATDIHTHIYSKQFGSLLLWGIDDLLTYHYLVAEAMRWTDMPYEQFWALSKPEQADFVWKTLFVERSPYSESCRGVLTVLERIGLDVSSRDLAGYRSFFQGQDLSAYVDRVFELAGVESVVMTNDPFDDLERPVWFSDKPRDTRFLAALRIDTLLNTWGTACPKLREWGYDVHEDFRGQTDSEVCRFLEEWIRRMDALYVAVSLPPTFEFPEQSPRGRLIERCVLPVTANNGIPFAMMIGVKKLLNPALKLAGDSVGKARIEALEYLCLNYPNNKFLVTMLSRENQHELCVTARKFRNLMIFGCWWFLNIPSLIEEMTQMRFELLGTSVIPQHSDARVLDQVIYKWDHSRSIIGKVLTKKYVDIADTGWEVTPQEILRDVEALLSGNFWNFLGRSRC